ncbi:MAG: RecQ family ATP-dependent DNA helicase [Bacteroidaceae bacterium]|nr:RecQ family ATP-dependent DNA helicase [Bacteroidaceae bacterium]
MNRYRDILKQYWGYDSFRGIQEEIIQSIGNGRDTLGLMPTGGGKSITFQVPALAQGGVCLVITPLIALMKDQVSHLRAKGIKAAAIYAGMTREEIVVALENCIFGNYKFLYISPERLSSELFQIKLRRMKVSFITVDESHCISQWGYDFRPSYLHISDIRKLLPDIPILALTATATPEVVKDIQQKLEFREENFLKMSFERKNLGYVVRHTEDKMAEMLHILQRIQGSAIVYVRSRNRTREVAEWLVGEGISAEFYHAGIPHVDKDDRQRKWQQGVSRVMVATNAFGMGIDKSNVRVVIHLDIPDSPEAYFQEAGRAGRDGLQAYAVLLVGRRDVQTLRQRIPETFPDKKFICEIYEHLSYYYQVAMGSGEGVTHEFDINKFCRNFKHFPVQTESALRILTQAGYIEYVDEQENDSRLMFVVHRDELYSLRDDPSMDVLLRALMRSYTGLFTDYVYIDEHRLARETGTTFREVYDALKSLNFRGVIHYIPYKKTPLIRYVRQREEIGRLVISADVYDKRKEALEKRVGAMVEYATSADKCRSRMLLAYFGEHIRCDCQMCDVCCAAHASGVKNSVYNHLCALLDSLSQEDGEVSLTLFCKKAETICSRTQVMEVLRFLQANERVRLVDGEILHCQLN